MPPATGQTNHSADHWALAPEVTFPTHYLALCNMTISLLQHITFKNKYLIHHK